MALRVCESVRIQQRANATGTPDQFPRVVRVAMPRKKIQRQRIAATSRKKVCQQATSTKGFTAQFSGITKSRSTDFKFWKLRFDGSGRCGIQFEKLIIVAGPHHGAVLRLIPDFPVADVVARSVRPALVVMANDAETNLRP